METEITKEIKFKTKEVIERLKNSTNYNEYCYSNGKWIGHNNKYFFKHEGVRSLFLKITEKEAKKLIKESFID